MPSPLTPRLLGLDGVKELRSLALRFGGTHGADKPRALDAAASCAIADPAVLIAYHDCLLCLLAYPESRSLRDVTRAELKRVAGAARGIMAAGPARARAKLANSGIAWTDVTISFGWDIARWLVERFPARADLDSFGENGLAPQSILGEALAPMEFELAAVRRGAARFHRRGLRGQAGHAARRARPRVRAAAVQRCVARPPVRGDAAVHRHPAGSLDAVADLRPRPSGRHLLPPRRTRARRRSPRAPRPSAARAAAPFRSRTAARRRCRSRHARGAGARNGRHRPRLPRRRALLRAGARRRARALHDAARTGAARSTRTSA